MNEQRNVTNNTTVSEKPVLLRMENIEKAFPGVPFYLVYSRHHMAWKGTRSPRPRFHIIFPIDPITNGDDYRMLKESVMAFFPFFDTGAKDAARFFFGVLDPVVELHGGENNEP